MEEKRSGPIYSHYGVSYDKGLIGLFRDCTRPLTKEDDILSSVVQGSRFQKRHIVGIGFKKVNGPDDLPIDDLYLSIRGFVDSTDPREEHTYQKLKDRSSKTHRLTHHLNDQQIVSLLPAPGSNPNHRPIPHYIELDDDRVLALFVTK